MTQSTVFGAVPAGSGQQVLDDLNLSDQALATEHEGTSAPSETQPFMRWRNDTDKLLYRRDALNSGWEIIENYGTTTDPDDRRRQRRRLRAWLAVDQHQRRPRVLLYQPGGRRGDVVGGRRCRQRRQLGVRPRRRGGGGIGRLQRRPDRRWRR